MGRGAPTAQDKKSLGIKQTAFDAEKTAIEDVLRWFGTTKHRSLVIHSDSTSAIARAGHTGAGPSQHHAIQIFNLVSLALRDRSAPSPSAGSKGTLEPLGMRQSRKPGR
jgi:hypothetical protein